ncbi:hypothetical protein [Hydrogenovibrio halophilus]|uniref:hypothetical protein n=1 Tax=Hydrogenovibrio halophilus TaxID=373391 RepID=UPI00037EC181|nr:hypothetical protein [Hydrogenovibrio halophilus]
MRTTRDIFTVSGVAGTTLLVTANLYVPWTVYLWLLWAPYLGLGIYDMTQPRHTILRLYPVIGHLRYLFEAIRPEIQQYFVEDDTSGMPVSREFRSLIYHVARKTPSFTAGI